MVRGSGASVCCRRGRLIRSTFRIGARLSSSGVRRGSACTRSFRPVRRFTMFQLAFFMCDPALSHSSRKRVRSSLRSCLRAACRALLKFARSAEVALGWRLRRTDDLQFSVSRYSGDSRASLFFCFGVVRICGAYAALASSHHLFQAEMIPWRCTCSADRSGFVLLDFSCTGWDGAVREKLCRSRFAGRD